MSTHTRACSHRLPFPTSQLLLPSGYVSTLALAYALDRSSDLLTHLSLSLLSTAHGCNKTATTRVTVKIPDGVTGVKPQLISPWQIEIKTRPLVPPTSETNTTADEISWFGGFLPEEYYMDFGMTMKLPDGPDGKTVAFDVIQECVTGKNEWVGQIAPKITLMKNGTLVKAEDFGFNASNAQLGPATNSQQTNSAGRVGLSIAGVVGVVGSLVALL